MASDDIFETLAASDLFRGVPAPVVEPVRSAVDEVSIDAGARLFAEGDPGDALYAVAAGRLVATVRARDGATITVGDFTAGQCVGEMALLTGRPRTATVTAETPARLARLSKAAFERLIADAPDVARTLADAIGIRFHTQQIARPLANLFGELTPEEVRDLQRRLTWVRLAPGDTLFHQGDAADAVYLVLSGRLHAIEIGADGTRRVVNEMGLGESVGEMALITESARSLSVEAARETHLARLTASDFDSLVDRHPRVLKHLARLVLERSRRATSAAKVRVPVGAASVGVLPLPGVSRERFAEFVERFVRGVERALGPTLVLDAARFDAAFGRPGAAETPRDHPADVTIGGWLGEQEAGHRAVVYVADATTSAWTGRCLAQADRLLLVAEAAGDPVPSLFEREVTVGRATPRELVLLHPQATTRPLGSARWLNGRNLAAHHQVRLGSDADAASAARRVVGRPIALVLSGGAARGFAHVGVLKALEEAGWPIDLVAGTSMGAVIGGVYSAGYTHEGMVKLALSFGSRRRLFDITPPVVSFLASKKVSNVYREMFGEACFEDLWRPFFCISTNLTRARPFHHERGEIWRAVRASSSIAGLFTPVAWDGDLLVDGATMNNWPVDLVRNRYPLGTVIAVHVNPEMDTSTQYEYGEHLSGFQALLHHVFPGLGRHRRGSLPFIASIMTDLSLVNDAMLTAEKSALADLVIVPDVRAFNPLNFGEARAIIDSGYRAGTAALAALKPPAAVAPASAEDRVSA